MQTHNSEFPETVDVLVVGAGIVGLASAYHIKRRDPSLKVLVVDKASAAGQGDTAKSATSIRNIFTSEISRSLSNATIDFYEDLQEKQGVPIGLRLIGYLWMMTASQFHQFQRCERDVRKSGVELRIWTPSELQNKLPGFRPSLDRSDSESQLTGLEDIVAGVQGLRCGILSVEYLVSFFEDEFRKLGGQVAYGLPVDRILVEPENKVGIEGEPFEWQKKKITGVRTPRGNIRARMKTVIAPGAWGRQLLDPIGIDSHMYPVRKMIFVLRGPKVEPFFRTKGFNKYDILPFTVLPKGVYLRPVPGERSVYASMSEGLGNPLAASEDPAVDERFYIYNVNPVLSTYFPDLAGLRPSSMWAGRQDLSSTDKNPYVFENSNAVIALGTTGNGIMKADSIGRIVSSLVFEEREAELYGGRRFDVSKLGVGTRVIEHETLTLTLE
jgi:glycine/D-amino acid oxidase-like deaminating enzyme